MIDKCVSCGGGPFTDQPEGYHERRWPNHEGERVLMTRCDACGAVYPISAVDPKVRKES